MIVYRVSEKFDPEKNTNTSKDRLSSENDLYRYWCYALGEGEALTLAPCNRSVHTEETPRRFFLLRFSETTGRTEEIEEKDEAFTWSLQRSPTDSERA